jgi:ferredoxin
MTHVITSLCLRDGGCVTVCPVECIVPGKPEGEWPWFYIDPETCIDCGACIPECPFKAIFPGDEVPQAYSADVDKVLAMPMGTPGFNDSYDGQDHEGNPVHLENTRILKTGEEVDLTPDTEVNAAFFSKGPGYEALKE